MTENIIHLVLARTPDAPAGTKGLSLFIVPKLRLDGTPNDVAVAGIEHKMGIKASSTAQLVFGDNDDCIGELVGTVENKGMSQMFHLMNYARIGVGLQGLALASSAYLNALDYAKDRKQGTLDQAVEGRDRAARADHRAPRRAPHAARHEGAVEGIRALAVKLTMHIDRADRAREDRAATRPRSSTTRARSTCSCRWSRRTAAIRRSAICATAIQVYGGAGYLKD